MHFIHPQYLWGLLAVAIPVVIHLFNFRRYRKIYFTNVRFIQNLQLETQKQSRLRHFILLALRCLAIIALVLAFAQPYIPQKNQKQQMAVRNAVSIFVDNSFSMEAVGSNGTLLDEAKQKAKEIVAAYKPNDVFQLLTNDFEGRHQRLYTRDEFLTLLDDVKTSSASRKMNEITGRQKDLLKTSYSSNQISYLVSDFQKSIYTFDGVQPDSVLRTYLIPVAANKIGNVYIDTCWFEIPTQQVGQTATLDVQVWNKSETDLEKIPIRLEINGTQKSLASVDLKAGASGIVKIPFVNQKAGIQSAVVQVTDYPVVYDDKFYFSFEVAESMQVFIVNGGEESRFLNSLFSNDSAMKIKNGFEKSIDYSAFSNYNLIILNELSNVSSGLSQELKRYVENGGTLCVLPPAASTADMNSYNSFLTTVGCPQYQAIDTADTRVIHVAVESPIFLNVFEKTTGEKYTLPENTELPKVLKHYTLNLSSRNLSTSVMRMLNNHEFLTETHFAQGKIYQFAVPLNQAFSNFQQQALFVPALYNIALMSQPQTQLYHTLDREEAIHVKFPLSGSEKILKLKSVDGQTEMIPEIQRFGATTNIFVHNQLTQAGNYVLSSESQPVAGVSFNYDRYESDLDCWTPAELNTLIEKNRLTNTQIVETKNKPVGEILAQVTHGTHLWKYLIWFVLLMLLGEVLILRFWKK